MAEFSITLWQGRDIRELSHDELLEAFVQLGDLYMRSLKQHRDDLNALFPRKESSRG